MQMDHSRAYQPTHPIHTASSSGTPDQATTPQTTGTAATAHLRIMLPHTPMPSGGGASEDGASRRSSSSIVDAVRTAPNIDLPAGGISPHSASAPGLGSSGGTHRRISSHSVSKHPDDGYPGDRSPGSPYAPTDSSLYDTETEAALLEQITELQVCAWCACWNGVAFSACAHTHTNFTEFMTQTHCRLPLT